LSDINGVVSQQLTESENSSLWLHFDKRPHINFEVSGQFVFGYAATSLDPPKTRPNNNESQMWNLETDDKSFTGMYLALHDPTGR
jgi:hypothetical protein